MWIAPVRRCLALAIVALTAGAQDYPSHPITMVMPYAPGGPGTSSPA